MSRETSELPLCLVIEDQTLVAISIESYLENAGMCVHTVASTAEARAWLVSNTADVAIIDIMLGDSAATELARELARCAIPFVIYSGHPRAGAYRPNSGTCRDWKSRQAGRNCSRLC